MQIDRDNTYIIIEDSNNTFFKMPLNALGGMIAMANEENEAVNLLIDAIDELSAYIIELSSEFIENHYSLEELSTVFEMKSDVDYLSIDKTILTENDVEKFIAATDIILKDDADALYDLEEQDADSVFDKIDNEADSYDVEELDSGDEGD